MVAYSIVSNFDGGGFLPRLGMILLKKIIPPPPVVFLQLTGWFHLATLPHDPQSLAGLDLKFLEIDCVDYYA